MSISIVLNAAIAVVGPFFPPEAEKRGVDMKTIGYIFSSYPAAFVVVCLLMPTIMHYTNQRTVFVISSIIYALSVAGFGSIVYLDRKPLVICGFIFRILQGSSNAAIYTISYSIFSLEFEGKDFMKVNSLFKGTIGVGILVGLVAGTMLYIVGGYFLPFIVYCCLMLVFAPFAACMIPPKAQEDLHTPIDQSENDSEICEEVDQSSNSYGTIHKCESPAKANNTPRVIPVTFIWSLITNAVITKCLILAIIDMSLLNFAPAILSKRLAEMKVDRHYYGIFFALPFVFPIFSTIIVVKIMDKIDNHILLCVGKLFMAIGFMLIGPSYFWGFNENIWVMLAGISILGFSASFAVIPLLPIIMTEIKSKFSDNQSCIIDTASSLYNSAFGVGNILGPIVGAHLSANYGFRTCTDILSHFSFLLFLILLIGGNYKKIISCTFSKKYYLPTERTDESERASLSNTTNNSRPSLNRRSESSMRNVKLFF